MQPQLSTDPAATAPEPEALIHQRQASFGLVSRPVRPEIKRIGAAPAGEWYIYGDTPNAKDRTPVDAIATPRIMDIAVAMRGKTSKFGARPYLDVTMAGEVPAIRYILSLPCAYNDQRSGKRLTPHAVRSLLGCLITLDLPTTGVLLVPTRGTDANFTNVYLDPAGEQQVRAEKIGDDECSLQQAVDTCRRKLGLRPQFTLQDAAVQSSLDLTP
jgi:hypothetical protein